MKFPHFLTKIPKIKSIINKNDYNGVAYQLKLAPKERLNFDLSKIINPKEAGVLALFYPKNKKTHIVLMLRSQYKGTHSAQISFPGGKKEKSDNNIIQTALRESNEEIGIDQKQITNIISLTKLYIPPSNFWVYPVIAISNSTPNFNINYEVEKLIEIDIDHLLNTKISTKKMTTSYAKSIDVPCFILNGYTIWGATAMILSEIKDVLLKTNYLK